MSTCNIALLDSSFGMGVMLQERERGDEEEKKGFAFKQLALSPCRRCSPRSRDRSQCCGPDAKAAPDPNVANIINVLFADRWFNPTVHDQAW